MMISPIAAGISTFCIFMMWRLFSTRERQHSSDRIYKVNTLHHDRARLRRTMWSIRIWVVITFAITLFYLCNSFDGAALKKRCVNSGYTTCYKYEQTNLVEYSPFRKTIPEFLHFMELPEKYVNSIDLILSNTIIPAFEHSRYMFVLHRNTANSTSVNFLAQVPQLIQMALFQANYLIYSPIIFLFRRSMDNYVSRDTYGLFVTRAEQIHLMVWSFLDNMWIPYAILAMFHLFIGSYQVEITSLVLIKLLGCFSFLDVLCIALQLFMLVLRITHTSNKISMAVSNTQIEMVTRITRYLETIENGRKTFPKERAEIEEIASLRDDPMFISLIVRRYWFKITMILQNLVVMIPIVCAMLCAIGILSLGTSPVRIFYTFMNYNLPKFSA